MSVPPITPARKRAAVASLPPTIPNLDSYEPVSRGLISDAVWFLKNPTRRYRVRAVVPVEGAAFCILVAEQRDEPEVTIKRPMWGRIVCYRETADGLKISRRATLCTRQEARAIEKRCGDEASAQSMRGDPRLRYTDALTVLECWAPSRLRGASNDYRHTSRRPGTPSRHDRPGVARPGNRVCRRSEQVPARSGGTRSSRAALSSMR
jgi:hypothetical protein